MAVLVAIGVSESGKRHIFATSVAFYGAEAHWRNFLRSLQGRQLHGVKLFISDGHEGRETSGGAVFASVPWWRTQFYYQQNAQAYVP